MIREWLKRRLAGPELDELWRWRHTQDSLRQWIGYEFPGIGDVLDHLRLEARGVGADARIDQLRDRLRARRIEPHFNKLTPAEAERLALLIEESGETLHAVGKILRHGYESRHPDGGPSNREMLSRELGDACHAFDLLCDSGDLSADEIADYRDKKAEAVKPYLHHQGRQS